MQKDNCVDITRTFFPFLSHIFIHLNYGQKMCNIKKINFCKHFARNRRKIYFFSCTVKHTVDVKSTVDKKKSGPKQ